MQEQEAGEKAGDKTRAYKDIRDRVALGAQLCDEHVPGWYVRVNVAQLDVRNAGRDVIGQVFGCYHRDTHRLGFAPYSDEAFEMGFCAYSVPSDPRWRAECAALTEAWQDAVSKRVARQRCGPVH